jgi:hypothetical protein
MTDQHKTVQSPEPPPAPSDIRVKQDVEPLGRTGEALPLYSFRYLGGDIEYVGVMAQDVLKVRPDAVTTGEDGFYRVNYAKLGLRMVTRADWDRSPGSVFATPGNSPEPPPDESDVRLKQDIQPLGDVSPEPSDDEAISDARLKRGICKVGEVYIAD